MGAGEARACPVCRGEPADPFFELPGVPACCHVQHESREAALAAPRGDIRLAFCRACGMIWNIAFEPDLLRYGSGYENALHFSPRFREYAAALARRLAEAHRLAGKTVVEIGCGDGHFLGLLGAAGASRCLGFDPSAPEGGPPERAVELSRESFRAELVPDGAELFCCRHVLEHVAEPREFLRELRVAALRRERCVVYLEVPDARFTLGNSGVFDVLYEHCSYFTEFSLTALLRATEFEPLRVTSAFAGQFLGVEAIVTLPPTPAGPAARPAAESSELAALVDRFGSVYRTETSRWQRELAEHARAGRRVALWGAGTKGVMFLNAVVPAADLELAVVDVNPRKHGRFVAGTGQEIVPPERLENFDPDVVLAMNRAYEQEIRDTMSRLRVRAALLSP